MTTDILSVGVFLTLAGIVAALDVTRRAIWRGLPIIGTALAFYFGGSWWGLLFGVVVPLLADLPLGDVAVGGMLGAWLGIEGMILVWVFAFSVALGVWIGYREGFWEWPGDWPFTPFVLVPACAIVLGGYPRG